MGCNCNQTPCSCVDGLNSFTTTAANFTQPAVSGTVSVSTTNLGQLNNQWMAVGQVVFITGGGYYTVSSITDLTTVVLTNLGYTGNASPGATVTSGGLVTAGGLQGVAGPAVNGTTVLYNEQTAASTASNSVWETLMTYSMPQDTLGDDGDILEVDVRVNNGGTSNGQQLTRFSIDGAVIATLWPITFTPAATSALLKLRVFRLSATSVRCQSVISSYSTVGATQQALTPAAIEQYHSIVTVTNLDSGGTLDFDLDGQVASASDTLTADYMTIKLCTI